MAEMMIGPRIIYESFDIDEDDVVKIRCTAVVFGEGDTQLEGVATSSSRIETFTVTPIGLKITDVTVLRARQRQTFSVIAGDLGGSTIVSYEWYTAESGSYEVAGQVEGTATTQDVTYVADNPDYCIWGRVNCRVTLMDSQGNERSVELTEQFKIQPVYEYSAVISGPDWLCLGQDRDALNLPIRIQATPVVSHTGAIRATNYRWSVSRGTIVRQNEGLLIYEPPDDTVGTVTVTCVLTFQVASRTVEETVTYDINLFDVSLNDVTTVQVGSLTSFTATVTPTIPEDVDVTYGWSAPGDGTIESSEDNVAMFRAGSRNGTGTIRSTVSVGQTGRCTVEEEFMVSGQAVAPTITIDCPLTIGIGQAITISAIPSGGLYDTIEYAWTEIPGNAGTFTPTTGPSFQYTPRTSPITFTVVATVRGTGNRAAAGSSAVALVAQCTMMAPFRPSGVGRINSLRGSLGTVADIDPYRRVSLIVTATGQSGSLSARGRPGFNTSFGAFQLSVTHAGRANGGTYAEYKVISSTIPSLSVQSDFVRTGGSGSIRAARPGETGRAVVQSRITLWSNNAAATDFRVEDIWINTWTLTVTF